MDADRTPPDEGLATAIAAFLDDLTVARRSSHTRRAFTTTLHLLAAMPPGSVQQLTVAVLQRFFATYAHLQPARRARQQAAVQSFLTWAMRHGYLAANPMLRNKRVRPDPPAPRGVKRAQVEAILSVIPPRQVRDRQRYFLYQCCRDPTLTYRFRRITAGLLITSRLRTLAAPWAAI